MAHPTRVPQNHWQKKYCHRHRPQEFSIDGHRLLFPASHVEAKPSSPEPEAFRSAGARVESTDIEWIAMRAPRGDGETSSTTERMNIKAPAPSPTNTNEDFENDVELSLVSLILTLTSVSKADFLQGR